MQDRSAFLENMDSEKADSNAVSWVICLLQLQSPQLAL